MKNPIRNSVISALIVWASIPAYAQQESSSRIDSRDGKETDHTYHQTNLPGTFTRLPSGETRPGGWIKAQLVSDLETGFTGHLDSLTHYARSDIFGKNKITGIRPGEDGSPEHIPKSWWPGETIPVWLDGYVRAAFLTGHPGAKAKMDAFMQHLLDHQEEDGYIGIYLPETRYNHTTENAELWSQSRIFRVMLAYYEFTRDRRVLNAVRKAVDLTMDHYGPERSYFSVENALGGVSHGLMFTDILGWLYRLTGDNRYITFGEFLYHDYTNFDVDRLNDARLDYLLDPEREIVGHTPHIAEHLRVPAWLFHGTGTQKYRRAYETGYAKLEQYMVPSGAVHSGHREDVEGTPPTPDMAYEYCGITELFDTQKFLLEKTGETRYADSGEKLVLNAGQGARLPDGTCVNYFSRDNRYRATSEGSGGRFKFSPTHEEIAVCCNPNASKLMPYYVDGMWMKRSGDSQGLVAMFYGPSNLETKITGTMVRIRQETHFPFSDTVRFLVEPEKQITFEIWLRIPAWCDEMRIEVENGEITEQDGFKIIHRSWSHGDSFRVTLVAGIQALEAVNGEIAFQRGPLLYSLPIPHEQRKIKDYALKGFADYEFTPTGDDLWNLHLDPAQLQNGPPFIHEYEATSDILYPWDGTLSLLKGQLCDQQGDRQEVNLVPLGTTILRRLTFPIKSTPFMLGVMEYPGEEPGTVDCHVKDGCAILENNAIRGKWQFHKGRITSLSLENRHTGQLIDFGTGHMPSILLSNGHRINLDSIASAGPLQTASNSVETTFSDNFSGLEIGWSATLKVNDNAIIQSLQIKASRDTKIQEILFVNAPVKSARQVGSVDGSVVVCSNLFMALEHPLAKNEVNDGMVRCNLPRGNLLNAGRSWTYTSVFGAVPEGQLRRGFLYYLERRRAHPYRPYLHYNNWYNVYLSRPVERTNEAECLETIKIFGEKLVRQRGVKMDAFVWDDGWDDFSTLWNFHKGFPYGFKNLDIAADSYGASQGVWMSPWGGYGPAKEKRIAYGKSNGYEINSGGFSMAGEKYGKAFQDVCLNMMREHDVTFFKFDGMGGGNEAKGAGIETADDIDAVLDLTRVLRQENPDLFISATIGTWPSPFWLLYACSIWRQGGDNGLFGEGDTRQQWITYRDMYCHERIVQQGPLYPLNSLMLGGIIVNDRKSRSPSRIVLNEKSFADEVWTFFGSGTNLQELYINPDNLTEAMWDELAAAARWSRGNSDVLVDTHWIGGDPGQGEVYGWASWRPGKGVLVLRNPSGTSREYTMELNTAFELPDGAVVTMIPEMVYPQKRQLVSWPSNLDEQFSLFLQPFETIVIEL